MNSDLKAQLRELFITAAKVLDFVFLIFKFVYVTVQDIGGRNGRPLRFFLVIIRYLTLPPLTCSHWQGQGLGLNGLYEII